LVAVDASSGYWEKRTNSEVPNEAGIDMSYTRHIVCTFVTVFSTIERRNGVGSHRSSKSLDQIGSSPKLGWSASESIDDSGHKSFPKQEISPPVLWRPEYHYITSPAGDENNDRRTLTYH
jgi:hypothetical protein